MTTIDLSTPTPQPDGVLDALPRRIALTLPELLYVAAQAGGAPLPFDLVAADASSGIEDRLGQSRGTTERQAYESAVGALHDPETSLTRRGLLSDGAIDEGLVGAVGLLATPEVAMDVDVAAGGVQAKAWHRQAGGAVATLATSDGIVFELAWFPTALWPAELGRIAAIPEDLTLSASQVPALVNLPYELVDAASEATRSSRSDLLNVLAAQHSGAAHAEGSALSESDTTTVLAALSTEAQGRLRAMVAQVSDTTAVVGVVSWVMLADGWHALRPREVDGVLRVDVNRVEPSDFAAELAPVLAEVTR